MHGPQHYLWGPADACGGSGLNVGHDAGDGTPPCPLLVQEAVLVRWGPQVIRRSTKAPAVPVIMTLRAGE